MTQEQPPRIRVRMRLLSDFMAESNVPIGLEPEHILGKVKQVMMRKMQRRILVL